jgi:hypothetical protein
MHHRLKPGWYYSIELDADDPWYSLDPIICVNSSDISFPDSSSLIHLSYAVSDERLVSHGCKIGLLYQTDWKVTPPKK